MEQKEKPDPVRVNETSLNQMIDAVEQDRIHQGEDKRWLREQLRNGARRFIPDRMPEDFYRGMLSASLVIHAMLPETYTVDYAMITIEEVIRIILSQVIEERARRSMEAVNAD